jgi:hypothetical protein
MPAQDPDNPKRTRPASEMVENPYQAPKDTAALDQSRRLPKPLFAFMLTTACFYAVNLLAFSRIQLTRGSGMLLACVINLPAMPFFAATIGVVETQSPWIKKLIDEDFAIGCLLIALGPVLWGLFAAYISWRRSN